MDMTPTATELMRKAIYQAKEYEDNKFRPEHILLSIIMHEHNTTVTILRRLNFDMEALFEELSVHLTNNIINRNRAYISNAEILPSKETKLVIGAMKKESSKVGDGIINDTHIMLAILKTSCAGQKMLVKLNLNYKIFKNKLMAENISNDDFDNPSINPKKRNKPTKKENTSKTPALDGFCKIGRAHV